MERVGPNRYLLELREGKCSCTRCSGRLRNPPTLEDPEGPPALRATQNAKPSGPAVQPSSNVIRYSVAWLWH